MNDDEQNERKLAEDYLLQVVRDFAATLPPSARGPVVANASAAITVLASVKAHAPVAG